MSTPIPGYAVVGWGFNIFGQFTSSSTTEQIFAMPDTGKTYPWETDDGQIVTYNLPDNVDVNELRETQGESRVFDTRSEVQTFFSTSAGVSGKSGGFDGQFEAMYSRSSQNDSEYSYGMIFNDRRNWQLILKDQSEDALAPWVLEAFAGVPSEFNDETKSAFYDFFGRYGTHYVHTATAGSRLYYNEAVSTSYNSDHSAIQANMNLEYKALFTSTKGNAEAQWQQVGYEYTENRTASVIAIGGTSQILDVILPGYGDSFADLYDTWRLSADVNPAVVDFDLRPMWEILSGDQATAMQQAFDSYAHDRIFASSKLASTSILVLGNVEQPAESLPEQTSGFQVSVVRRADLSPVLNKFYSFAWDGYWNNWTKMYDSMYADLESFKTPDYIVVFTTYYMLGTWFPTQQMYNYLLSCGASSSLAGWEDVYDLQASEDYKPINYVLVGVPTRGPNNGFEAFTKSSSFAQPKVSSGLWYWSTGTGGGAPTATVDVLVRLVQNLSTHELSLFRETQGTESRGSALSMAA